MQNKAAVVLAALQARGHFLAIAESLTGGLLAAEFVAVPGASKVFLGSITAYRNSLKQNLLDVPDQLLENHGAVSSEVAEAMAIGVREQLAKAAGLPIERVVGLATTGVAGPDPDGEKPVGLVYVGLAVPGSSVTSVRFEFDGDRSEIRGAAVRSAVSELFNII